MCVDNSAFMSLTVFAAPRPVGGSEKNLLSFGFLVGIVKTFHWIGQEFEFI